MENIRTQGLDTQIQDVRPDAQRTARALLDGYFHQDRRMHHLLQGAYPVAETEEQKALDRMADAYNTEFPDNPDARDAGRAFMYASFAQDEIENWQHLKPQDNLPHTELAVTPTDTVYDDPLEDPRWEQDVRRYLEHACELAGIDPAYAREHTSFMKAHHADADSLAEQAIRAHSLKVQSIADVDEDTAQDLATYFLRGSELHDDWTMERDDAFYQTVDLVTEYYDKLYRLRE